MTRGRRKARNQLGMNLFPFLAVLICTMGSLIVLLVVMVQQAQVRAHGLSTLPDDAAQHSQSEALKEKKRREREEQERLAKESQQEFEDLQWKASVLRQTYEQATQRLSESRLALSHLEAHARELSEQTSDLQAEADAIARSAQNQELDRDQAQQEITRLRQQIQEKKQELAETLERVKDRRNTYALIPYDGPNGTNRRPIYVECLPDRVVLQPEGVTLVGEDFREPLGPGNPLAAALRAKREFLLQQGLLSGDDEPYPLLVVRPHAAASYAAARLAMKAWEAEFGYELIEEEVELDYPEADPRLTTTLEDVVADARERQRLVRAVRSGTSRSRRPQGLLRASSRGGFERVGRAGAGSGSSVSSGLQSYGAEDTQDGYGPSPFGTGDRTSRAGSGAGSGRAANGPSGSGPGGSRAAAGTSEFDANLLPGGGSGGGSDFPTGDHPRSSKVGHGAQNSHGGDESAATGLSGDRAGAGGSSPQGGSGGTSGGGGSSSSGAASGAPGAGRPSFGADPFTDSRSLARSRGRDWALPDAVAEAVGIKRPIRVICDPSRLVVVPERGTKDQLAVFKHEGSLQAVIDPFVNSIRARLKSWGIAGRGIYWKPVLQVEVSDGAQGRYDQLVRLLENSGIQVTRQP